MAGDAFWPYVVLSMDFTGANGVTGWGSDQRGNAFAIQSGTPITSTSWAKSGSSSLYLSSTARIIGSANIPGLNFGSGDFEIGLWVYQTTRSGSVPACLLNFSTDVPAVGWRLAIGTNGAVSMYAIAGAVVSSAAGAVPLNTETHISVARISGTCYIRINGVLSGSGALGAFNTYSGALQISGAIGANWVYTGYMDRLEILKGAARHAPGSFTPETGLMLNYASQVSGVTRDAADAVCSRVVRAYNRATGALIGEATSDAGTGAYSMNLPITDEVNVVFLDDSGGTLYNDLIARVIPA